MVSSAKLAIVGYFLSTFMLLKSYGKEHTIVAIFISSTISLVVFCSWKIYLRPIWFSSLRKLPEPEGAHFFTGHSRLVPNERSGMPLQEWINDVPNNGFIRYRMLFNSEVIFVTSPKALSEVLVQKSYDFAKPYKLRQGLGRILGVGLIIAEGEQHKIQRKLLMPAFLHRHIRDLYPIFWEKSVSLVIELEKQIKEIPRQESKVFNIPDWLARTTLDILGVAGLGKDFDTLHNPDNEICTAYRNVFEQKPPRGLFALVAFVLREMVFNLLNIHKNDSISAATEILTGVARRLIREKKNEHKKGAANDRRSGNKRDIISVALQSGNFTDIMLENHLLTFLAAGHETTATSMTWALYAMCLYPDVQKRLRDEVRANLPIEETNLADMLSITAELINSLPYLHAVCNEVFRVYPPAGLTRRVAVKDTSILGQHIPKGTVVVISPRAINVSRELWGDDALDFKPDRWMGPTRANSGGGLTNFSFMTFLHGPRSCIGQGFARGEFACLLAALVGRFEIELEDKRSEIQIETGLTSRPRNGLRLRLRAIC